MDIAFSNPTKTGFDFATNGTDLVVGDALITMLIHALFRDARAPDGAVDAGQDPRGHWASALTSDAPDGSLLWLLAREKITPDKPYKIAEALEQACTFMIDETEGAAAPVVGVTAVAQKAAHRGRIEAQLTLHLTGTRQSKRFGFVYDTTTKTYDLKELA